MVKLITINKAKLINKVEPINKAKLINKVSHSFVLAWFVVELDCSFMIALTAFVMFKDT